jgi:hypothetical protein
MFQKNGADGEVPITSMLLLMVIEYSARSASKSCKLIRFSTRAMIQFEAVRQIKMIKKWRAAKR